MERALIACKRISRHRPITRSILLTMRLTTAIIFIGALQVSANGLAQKISFSGTNVPLSTVFHVIEEQTGYGVLMAKSTLESAKPVTINTTNGSLDEVLKTCFSFQPWKLQYSIAGKTIAISKVVENILPKVESPEPPAISGIVRNEEGVPLAGATVEIKALNKSGQTNEKGEFFLKGVPNGTHKVEITYIGYDKYTTEVTVQTHLLQMIADMKQATNILDKAEVIAYGTTTQRLSTGNVSVVNAKDIEKQPVSNPIMALAGRVPGLFITQANGMPGSSVTVRIQGQNSILNGNDPFYVIDGVPYSSQALQGLNAAGGNPLNFINPSDIESISVLKDADATAIYGSRAANGAILITTKKGKPGDARVSFNLQNGWGKVTRKLPVLHTQQYLEMRHEAIKNDGLTVNKSTDYDLNGTWDTTRYTDWQKVLIGGTAQYTNLDGSVSGGTTNTQYLIGGTYHKETTVFLGNFNDQKASVHTNLITSSANRRFHFQLSASYLFENNKLPWYDLTAASFQLAPDAPPLYNPDGSLNWALDSKGKSTWKTVGGGGNPIARNYNKYTNKNNSLISNLVLRYEIARGLEIKSSFGYTNQQINETLLMPLISTEPSRRSSTNRSAQYTYNNNNSFIIEPHINYKKNIGRGKLEALLGTTIQQNKTSQLQMYGLGYNTDLQLEDPMSASSFFISGSVLNQYRYNALFSRVTYNWEDKYLINITGRRDGSSRFGSANSFHNFGSIGAGWIFSKEKYFLKKMPFLSFGKLRASYGTTGSDQIGDYQFLSLYSSPYGQLPYQGIVAIAPQGLSNPYLQWEQTKKLDVGIDLGFLDDRILFNGTYVRNRSSNQLLPYTLPIMTGFISISDNFPATVQNTGLEFSINTTNIKSRSFYWSSRFNITIPKNKLLSFPNIANSSYANSSFVVGKPLTGAKVFHFLGVNDTTGIYQFADIKGNTTTNPTFGIDNYVFINLTPKFYGGFENSFSFKGFELSIFFQFVKQLGKNYRFGNNNPGSIGSGNEPTYLLNRWKAPGDKANIQRFSTKFLYLQQLQNANNSDAGYSDASYVRLKNLSVSWQLPKQWMNSGHIKDCKIYASGQNLLTITSYKGLDPEIAGGLNTGLPPLRVITFGLQATF